MASVFGLSCTALLLAFCYASSYSTISSCRLYSRARRWNYTEANITNLAFVQSLDQRTGYESMYCNLQYTYIVNGIQYNGSRANVWGAIDTSQFCDFILVRQQIKPMQCFYNPSNPSESILDRRLRPNSLCISVFVTISLGYAAFAALLFDGVLKLLPRFALHLISFGSGLTVVFFCYVVEQMVQSSTPVRIALASALFFCTTFTFLFIGFDRMPPLHEFE